MRSGERPVRACLVTNARAGRGPLDLTEPLRILRAHGWEVVVRSKRRGGEATAIAREAVRRGFDVVVACAGDGTLGEVVDGLAGTDVAAGCIPGGTVNLWAREVGISLRPRVAALQLLTSRWQRVDLGHVEVNGRRGRHFLLMAGMGVDGAVIARVSKPLKRRIGRLAVGVAALQAIPALSATNVRVELDGVQVDARVLQIVAGNTRLYGGFGSVTPTARMDDGLLDVCLFTAQGMATGARQLASLTVRGRPDSGSAELYRAATIRVHAPEVLPLQADGGKVSLKKIRPEHGEVVYSFTACPGAATMLVPATYDGPLFRAPTPTVSEPAAGACLHAGHDARVGETKLRLRVTSVGVDSISGVDAVSGAAVAVTPSADAKARNADGTREPLDDLLARLREGDMLQVRGALDGDGRLIARRLRLRAPDGE